nr:MAG TPA: hypothetical protein [Bacteriophage sp.]
MLWWCGSYLFKRPLFLIPLYYHFTAIIAILLILFILRFILILCIIYAYAFPFLPCRAYTGI